MPIYFTKRCQNAFPLLTLPPLNRHFSSTVRVQGKKHKYYAVARGNEMGIFSTPEAAQAATHQFPHKCLRVFTVKSDAERWLLENSMLQRTVESLTETRKRGHGFTPVIEWVRQKVERQQV